MPTLPMGAEGQQSRLQVAPLTRHAADGAPYRREADVERQITAAVHLAPAALEQRAHLADLQHPDFLQEEALVALIRAAHQAGDHSLLDGLSQVLLQRITGFLHTRLSGLGTRYVEDAVLDVVHDLFTRVVDQGSDRGDFLQVRFWLALHRLAISVARRYLDQRRRDAQADSLDVAAGHDGEGPMRDLPAPQVPLDERLAYRAALDTIPEPQRRAFILRYYEDWPIEDQDPSVPTISRYFNRTPRTIRTWLRQAHEALRAWWEEQS